METRDYDAERDLASVQRIWREVGWVDSDEEVAGMEPFLADGSCIVATIGDVPECAVVTHPGSIRYQDTDLDLSVVTAVTTSLIGRKQGFAKQLTAQALANAAVEGAAVSILGMFEQGFYNLFGFGSGSYEHHIRFDPATLRVDVPYRTPVRLTPDDWAEMDSTFAARLRGHGGVAIPSPGNFRAEVAWTSKPFGLGYRDDDGSLTHFVWGSTKGESGPYRVNVLSYRSTGELLELLKVLAVLGDQVRSITVSEPPEIQLQDLLTHVERQRIATKKSDHEFVHGSGTWWQLRILDLAACIAARSYVGRPVQFGLRITDPLEPMLDGPWTGVGGEYTITITESSTLKPGIDSDLAVLDASVNAFSRMWFGVRPATSLAVTDELVASQALLSDLDQTLALPQPHPGMFF